MPKGVLYVESRPVTPEQVEAYHQWYDGKHLEDVVNVEGFVSARRFAPIDGDGPFVAIYEIEGDDLAAVQARMREASAAGKFRMEPVFLTDPPPTVKFLEEITSYTPRRPT